MSAAKIDGLSIDVAHLPVEEAVAALIDHSAGLGVSDLFLGINESDVGIAIRHLGILRPIGKMPVELGRRCIAHIKAIAGMDVAEKRRPLDGRWIHRRPLGTIDLRINTIPTMYGEDITLRLLDRQSRLLTLEQLGLLQRDYNALLAMLNNPGGLIVVCGPTGSGKTTTLYAALSYLNNGRRKINTIEDPIEYALAGVRQSQVNSRINVDFDDLLRSVLRQAPDVIMIGEIRDEATAQTAVRAANSGHLVLATLHAPLAAGAVPSLLHLGVHPHFLASSLLGVIAQRLVRTLCPACRTGFDISESLNTFDEVRRYLEPGQGEHIYGPSGCEQCRGLGYAGHSGVFEVMSLSLALRKMIVDRQPVQALRQKASEEGTIEFRHAALLKVAQGQTSIEEVFRAIPSEYLGVECY